MTKDQIRAIFMANGFEIKEGNTDLKPYVYEAAEALLSASIADTAGAKVVAWRYDTQQGFSYHAQQLDHFYTGWDGEYVKGEPLYATPVDAEREKNEIIQALQKALFYWMPSIAGEDSPAGQKAAEHAYLLFGLNDNSVECYGDQIRAYVGIMNRQQEKLEIVLRDAGFEDGEDHIEFIEKLASRATPPAIAAPPAPSVADAFPYQKTFDAIAAATTIEGGRIGVSVRKFREAFGAASSVADAAGASEPTRWQKAQALFGGGGSAAHLPENIDWTRVMALAEKHGDGWSNEKGWSFHCDDDLFNFAGELAKESGND